MEHAHPLLVEVYESLEESYGPVAANVWWWWTMQPLPMWVVNFAHGLFVCYKMRTSLILLPRLPWLLSLSLSLGACLVGATVRYMLLGLRAEWLGSDTALPTYILTWLIVHWSYRDCVYKFIDSPVGLISITGLEMVHKAHTIIGAVDITVKTFTHPVWVGPIFIGAMSSCIGGFYKALVDQAMLGLHGATEITKPTVLGLKMGLYVSIFYFFTTDPYGVYSKTPFLDKESATMVIVVYLVLTGLATAILRTVITPFPIDIIERLTPKWLHSDSDANDVNMWPYPHLFKESASDSSSSTKTSSKTKQKRRRAKRKGSLTLSSAGEDEENRKDD